TAALGKVTGGDEAGEPLRQAVRALEAMGLGDFVAVDLTIVRGLAYYTGIVFELFDTGKSLRAVCGGGRYDGLLKALGGVDLPALGRSEERRVGKGCRSGGASDRVIK